VIDWTFNFNENRTICWLHISISDDYISSKRLPALGPVHSDQAREGAMQGGG